MEGGKEGGREQLCCMQLVSASPLGPFLDTWAPSAARRRQEHQLRELIRGPQITVGARSQETSARNPTLKSAILR